MAEIKADLADLPHTYLVPFLACPYARGSGCRFWCVLVALVPRSGHRTGQTTSTVAGCAASAGCRYPIRSAGSQTSGQPPSQPDDEPEAGSSAQTTYPPPPPLRVLHRTTAAAPRPAPPFIGVPVQLFLVEWGIFFYNCGVSFFMWLFVWVFG